MAATPSTMLELGTTIPSFQLPDFAPGADGAARSVPDIAGDRATVVMFICNHCPFVKHVQSELARLSRDYSDRGVAFVAISSNDVENYPDDAPSKMTDEARQAGWGFPYLYDESQEVAKAFQAACTPDFFVFGGDQRLVYRGQLDDSRPKNGLPVTGADLRAALDAVLDGREVSSDQKPSIGCNIKWKAGNQPTY